MNRKVLVIEPLHEELESSRGSIFEAVSLGLAFSKSGRERCLQNYRMVAGNLQWWVCGTSKLLEAGWGGMPHAPRSLWKCSVLTSLCTMNFVSIFPEGVSPASSSWLSLSSSSMTIKVTNEVGSLLEGQSQNSKLKRQGTANLREFERKWHVLLSRTFTLRYSAFIALSG